MTFSWQNCLDDRSWWHSISSHKHLVIVWGFFGSLVGYVFGSVPTGRMLRTSGLMDIPFVDSTMRVVYSLLSWMLNNFDIVREFFRWQAEFWKR